MVLVDTLRSYVCDGIPGKRLKKSEAVDSSFEIPNLVNDVNHFITAITKDGAPNAFVECEQDKSLIEIFNKISERANEVFSLEFFKNISNEAKVAIVNEKTISSQTSLLGEHFNNSFLNLSSRVVLNLVPYAEKQVPTNFYFNFEAPSQRIIPNKYYFNALLNLTAEELSQASDSLRLLVDIVKTAVEIVKTMNVRVRALAIQDAVSASIMKFGYYWEPNFANEEIAKTIFKLENRNNDLRMIGASSAEKWIRLRYRDGAVSSALMIMISAIISDLANDLDLKFNGQENLLFKGNKLFTQNEVAIAKFVERADWLNS